MSQDRCNDPGFARTRWVYGGASVLIGAYVTGLVLATAPSSAVVDDTYELAYPALELANVNNSWGFFSPDPGPGDLPRYEVVDGDGVRHEFMWMEELDRWDPAYFRYTTLYVAIIDAPELYGDGAARFLCERHRSLNPRKITFTVAHQVDVLPEDYLAGRGIMDDARVERLFSRRCDGKPLP